MVCTLGTYGGSWRNIAISLTIRRSRFGIGCDNACLRQRRNYSRFAAHPGVSSAQSGPIGNRATAASHILPWLVCRWERPNPRPSRASGTSHTRPRALALSPWSAYARARPTCARVPRVFPTENPDDRGFSETQSLLRSHDSYADTPRHVCRQASGSVRSRSRQSVHRRFHRRPGNRRRKMQRRERRSAEISLSYFGG